MTRETSSAPVRELGVTPHVARRQNGAIDERTSRHPGYAISLSKRWLVEKPFATDLTFGFQAGIGDRSEA